MRPIGFHLLQDPIYMEDCSPCLTAGNKNGAAAMGVAHVAGFKGGNGPKAHGIGYEEEISPTLSATPSGTNQVPCVHIEMNAALRADESKLIRMADTEPVPVVFGIEVYNSGINANGGHYISEGGVSPTLRANHPPGVCIRHVVRRLTPLECCRLQGFPDYWMDDVDGSDSAKYKMWGNGMALPCMLYVMVGIVNV